MEKKNVDYSGIWPLVEEFELREKAKKLGYVLEKERSNTEKVIIVLKELGRLTTNLRCFLLSLFVVASNWKMAIDLFCVWESILYFNSLFIKKKYYRSS